MSKVEEGCEEQIDNECALKRLVKLSSYRKLRWNFEDGWLILEAF